MSLRKKIILFFLFLLVCFPTLKSFGQSTARFESKYTSLIQCKKLANEGIVEKQLCPGLAGYAVYRFSSHDYHRGDDLSTHFLGFKKGQTLIELRSMSELWLGDSSGTQLEWRFKIVDGKKELIAWIYRVNQTLDVIRLESQNKKWCLLAEGKTNEEARQIADSDKTCGGITIFGLY